MGRLLRPQQSRLTPHANRSSFWPWRLAWMGIALLLFSCTGVHSVVKPSYRNLPPVREAADIEIVTEAPKKPHEIFGELTLTYRKASQYEKALEAMQKEAARLGADGILLDRDVQRFQQQWSVSGGQNERYRPQVGGYRYRIHGVIYLYLEE